MVKRPQRIGDFESTMVCGATSPGSSAVATVNSLNTDPSS